ncbi:multidrug ABC transporter permease [Reticulibacter mediterranei]|uniref:Multidrug ABC transporter permease n=1 Tax=Reticulibacter mediterranei TaxID=2778369 RepID=A0A8J3IRK8_9CHLR|nr:ABC-2 family transporter protein [Reticulibacter mediterranei]GHO99491.1 multidrug ABC transporter permease [Reticulibacter mediterranei]
MKFVRMAGMLFALSVKRELAFRTNLVFQLIVTLLTTFAELAALRLVYTQTATLAGWSFGHILLLFGTFQILRGLLATFVDPNFQWFSNQVRSGKLDALLLLPVPSILMVNTGTYAPIELIQIGVGIGVIGAAFLTLHISPFFWGVIGWLFLLAVGFIISWAARVLLASVVFWAASVELDVFYRTIWEFGRYPISIYRQPVRFLLTYIFPVAFLATYPASAFIEGINPLHMLVGGLLSAGFLVLVQLVWRSGLRRYTSATS